MSEPTEHDKQIAREATEKINRIVHSWLRGTVECYRIVLAAITAAKQEQNEDTARLLDMVWKGWFCETREGDGNVTRYAIYSREGWLLAENTNFREAIDAARGVQLAAKEVDHFTSRDGKIIAKDEEGFDVDAATGTADDFHPLVAAQHESAPAAEQANWRELASRAARVRVARSALGNDPSALRRED